MATTFEWGPVRAIETIISLTSAIADSSYISTTTAIANGTSGLYPYAAFEFNTTSLSAATGGYADLWLLPTMDGTNFADTAKFTQTNHLIGTFPLSTEATAAQRTIIDLITIPPLDFNVTLRNKAGASLTSQTTIKMTRYYDQGV
jgi:hypothetical protein